MNYYFSPSQVGFFTDEYHGDSKPADCMSITEAEWQALLDGQSTGKEIKAGPDGHPILVDPPSYVPPPPPTLEQKLASIGVTKEELRAALGL